MAKFALPTLDLPTFDLPAEVTGPLYAGVGATDLVVGYVRDAVADLQKSVTGVQKDVQTRIASFDFEPKALRGQAVTVVTAQIDALTKDAKARREAIEARVAELQSEAKGLPALVQGFVTENATTVTATYADLAKRGEVLVGRIRTQESTEAAATAAKTTTTKAKTTKTQAAGAAKKTTASTAKKATSTAKKTSAAPKSSAKATSTAAKKTAAKAAEATVDAAAKVGD